MSKSIKINGVWPLVLPDASADEWLGNMKYHHNRWEMPRLEALERSIKRIAEETGRKPIIMYIGAYKGDMAAMLATLGADIILMESTAAFWPLIKETWELNDLPEPVGFFSGLLGRESNQEFTKEYLTKWPERTAEYVEGAVGFTHLAESHDDPTFPRITIDDFIKVTGIVPDIITMDVEGSELPVMQGGLNYVIKGSAEYMVSIHPEFGYHNHGYYCRELFDLFADNGYAWDYIDFDHEFHYLFYRKQGVQ